MVDRASSSIEDTAAGSGWLGRLSAVRWILAAVGVVFFVFIALGWVGPVEALAGYAVVLGVALVAAPRQATWPQTTSSGQSGDLQNQAVWAFADTLTEPCIIINARTQILHCNPAGRRQFPSVREGNPIAFSIRHPALIAAIEKARTLNEVQEIEMHQTVPNETWFGVSVAPMSLSSGDREEVTILIVTLRNLTEQKRLDALRADFIANASHEMRTPLTSLMGFIDTLLGPAARDATARERFLVIMRGQAERMSKLVEDMMSLSRIELRQHVRPTGTVQLSKLIAEINETLQTQAQDAGVTVELALPDEPVTITGERDELFEVFENLLENAIKYGADGGRIDVALTAVPDRTESSWLVTVTDYGVGIAAEHVPRLTERFYRVDAESSRKKKGTGLGLAIVKHIVNRHHGTLSIRSRLGEGTRVEVLLP